MLAGILPASQSVRLAGWPADLTTSRLAGTERRHRGKEMRGEVDEAKSFGRRVWGEQYCGLGGGGQLISSKASHLLHSIQLAR